MTQAFESALAAFAPPLPLVVAFSGGADSTALLKACANRWPGRVRAVHVHHGLQAAGDDFERHCRSQCADWQVPLVVSHVDARHALGESPEAAARQARYGALAQAVRAHWRDEPTQSVALAQHADDQVETLLLALSRGAGLPGLASMPARWTHEGVPYFRPLLRVSRPAIEAWLAERGIACVDDPSNADARYTRNRIRHHVLPALAAVTPQWRDTLARSAGHAAQAQALLQEVAEEDLARVGVPPAIAALRLLTRPRLANTLRAWLARQAGAAASAAQLDELMDQVMDCATRGHQIRVKVGRGFVRRNAAHLSWAAGNGPS